MDRPTSVFDEVSAFIAGMDPQKVANFKPSRTHQKRLDFLLDKQKDTPLTAEEKSEVEQYLMLNRIVGLAKARAIKMLQA
ncbi:hypothetical protein [Fibrella aquatica]|uniref:hypothetical protein n=1 Tax=Fibrella aquatica TaxID=3242487 RepID=UPI003520A860